MFPAVPGKEFARLSWTSQMSLTIQEMQSPIGTIGDDQRELGWECHGELHRPTGDHPQW